jgi:hypothetical protein
VTVALILMAAAGCFSQSAAAHLSIVVLPFANLPSSAVKFTRIRKRAEIEIGLWPAAKISGAVHQRQRRGL